ncbi:hypothetical protein BJV82DRAFT_600575 [Fennellomyces sp. T-0311]|nr:hypothetical protein BJV82DRAFT_600575 [Fennellomyces sp. T-0311]
MIRVFGSMLLVTFREASISYLSWCFITINPSSSSVIKSLKSKSLFLEYLQDAKVRNSRYSRLKEEAPPLLAFDRRKRVKRIR